MTAQDDRRAEEDEGYGVPPLIPSPTTDLDRRVNRAFEMACQFGERRYVVVKEDDTILIYRGRPQGVPCVVVSPDRYAFMLAAGAEEPQG